MDWLLCVPDYCAEGSAAALPCPAGKRNDASLTVMVSESDCIICPEGTFCSVGSAEAQPCAPGTYSDAPEQETCNKCAAGTFQVLEGQTACDNCTAGCARDARNRAAQNRWLACELADAFAL